MTLLQAKSDFQLTFVQTTWVLTKIKFYFRELSSFFSRCSSCEKHDLFRPHKVIRSPSTGIIGQGSLRSGAVKLEVPVKHDLYRPHKAIRCPSTWPFRQESLDRRSQTGVFWRMHVLYKATNSWPYSISQNSKIPQRCIYLKWPTQSRPTIYMICIEHITVGQYLLVKSTS